MQLRSNSRAAATFLATWLGLSAIVQGQAAGQASDPDKLIHQFAPINWVENLGILSNGDILPIITLGTSAVLNKIDPVSNEIEEVHDFSSAGNAIQSITAVQQDVFVLNVFTCNITAISCTPGSASSWLVDYRQCFGKHKKQTKKPHVKKLVDWPEANFLNGMAALNGHTVLLADSVLGGIWKLNVRTEAKELLFTDPSMMGTSQSPTGVNGIRVRGGTLFFTNSAAGNFNSIAIDPKTGTKVGGNATVIASGLTGPDDFEVDEKKGVAYLANGVAGQVVRIDLQSGALTNITGLPGPTSLRWENVSKKDKLYASTCGGLVQYAMHNITLGGAVYEIDV